MTFYHNLDKYSDNIAIVTDFNQQITYLELLGTANNIEKHIKKRCIVFVICTNCVDSVAGYIGIMRSGAVPLLIHKTINKNFFLSLLETYKPEYIFLPSEINQLKLKSKIVYSSGRYELLKTDYNSEYAIHKDLTLLLTTS